uniref:non-specific serine/threonine protein kinase n=1 Tax=Panagrolaimus davidi TaxID=227884 RepID=A0A914P0P6_9BILA
MTSVVKNEKAEPSKVLNNSTDETASTESDENDSDFKPYEKRQKKKMPKVISNVLESLLPKKKGPKDTQQQPSSGKTKAENEKMASQSIKAATTKASDDSTPATATTATATKQIKKPPVKQKAKFEGPRAPIEERKKVLIGNLKPSNEHKICTSNARKTVKYLQEKVQQKQHFEEQSKLPAVGEKLSTKAGHEYTADKDVGSLLDEKKSISIATAVTIAQQSLLGLKDLHEIGYLHRDIKLENIVVAAGSDYQKVQLIDFGLSGKLPKFEEQHLADPPPSISYLVGNLKTASLAALKNQQQSRKDDLGNF